MSPRSKILSFLKDEGGATSIEYALIVSLLAISAIPALTSLGSRLSSTFEAVSFALEDAPPQPAQRGI